MVFKNYYYYYCNKKLTLSFFWGRARWALSLFNTGRYTTSGTASNWTTCWRSLAFCPLTLLSAWLLKTSKALLVQTTLIYLELFPRWRFVLRICVVGKHRLFWTRQRAWRLWRSRELTVLLHHSCLDYTCCMPSRCSTTIRYCPLLFQRTKEPVRRRIKFPLLCIAL